VRRARAPEHNDDAEVLERCRAEQLLAHSRPDPIGADEERGALGWRAVLKVQDDARVAGVKASDCLAPPHRPRQERVEKRRPQSLPRDVGVAPLSLPSPVAHPLARALVHAPPILPEERSVR